LSSVFSGEGRAVCRRDGSGRQKRPAGSWIWVGERRDLKGEEGLARLRRILEEIRPVPEVPVVYLVLISVPEAAERAVLEALGLA
jgi:hypothetical protein